MVDESPPSENPPSRLRWTNIVRATILLMLVAGAYWIYSAPVLNQAVRALPWSAQILLVVVALVVVIALVAWQRLHEAWDDDVPQFVRLAAAATLALVGSLAGADSGNFLHRWLADLEVSALLLVIACSVAALLLLLGWSVIRGWFEAGTIVRVVGGLFLLTFVVVVLLMAVVGHPGWNRIPRVLFVLIAITLPISLYWLFIFSRKQSILTEFLGYMVRLGVFDIRPNEDAELRRTRVEQYLAKFEAAYGRLSPALRRNLLDTLNPNVVTVASTIEVAGGANNLFFTQAVVPLVMAAVLLSIGWLIVLPLREEPTELVDALWSDLTPVTAAFLGAYAFSLQLLFRRFLRRDLRASAYLTVVIRILTVIGFIWVLSRLVGKDGRGLVALGFVFGWFPRFFWTILRGQISKVWEGGRGSSTATPPPPPPGGGAPAVAGGGGLDAAAFPSMDPRMPLTDLEGLTLWHEARLEEEDVENVENIATADILELMLVTRIAPDRLIDWVDQAILDTHLVSNAELRASIRSHGILQASQFIEVYRRSVLRDDVDAFEAIAGGNGRSRFRSLADALETNTNLRLIQRWKGLEVSPTPTPGRKPAPPL